MNEYTGLFAIYSSKVYQSVPVFSVNTEKPFTINKAASTIQNYKWFEWLKYSIPQSNSTLGVTDTFTLTNDVDVYIDTREVASGEITEMPYVGWDIAISKNGEPEIIEGNHNQGAYLIQYSFAVSNAEGRRFTIDPYLWFD